MWHLLKFATTLFRCIPAFFRNRNEQALVELALRQPLATYARRGPKPRITPVDRAFWAFLSRTWSGWKEVLVIVQPDTVVRWHRKGFERHLHRLLREYVDYYNEDRVHTRLGDSPMARPTEHRPSSKAQIVGLPRVGVLGSFASSHHRDQWREAA